MSRRLRFSPPLWARILAVVVGALAAAQVVTLALTVFFPPAPPRQYSLADIGAALRGGETRQDHERPLVLTFETSAPSLQSPGWVVSAPATRDLARLVGAPETDVRLLFYAPPPLAGAPIPPAPRAQSGRPLLMSGVVQVGQAGGAAGPRGPMGSPAGIARPMGPAGPRIGGMIAPGGQPPPGARVVTRSVRQPWLPGASNLPAGARVRTIIGEAARAPAAPDLPAHVHRPIAVEVGNGPPRRAIIRSPLEAAVFARPSFPRPGETETPAPDTVRAPPIPAPAPVVLAPAVEAPVTTPARIEQTRPAADATITAMPRTRPAPRPATPTVTVLEHTLAPPRPAAGFPLARAPYVEGEFVAAMRIADGRWATVRPQPEGFPNSWQRRILLWFGLSVALIAPLALFVAWRLAAPLKVFAESADRLGREPSADLPLLSGPAEIGKAADAFNLMQERLKRYVDDRTGMIRAISHDLRTPLTRMRFKLERAPPALRAEIGRDMDQMEEMIAQVLSFMRDEAQTASRQVVDLRSLIEVVVDDAQGPAELVPGPAVLVEIDVVGVQRVVENLVDNAIKYGGRATVSLDVRDNEAWIEVADEGPGLAADELDKVFKPFYRSAAARASGKSGVGLGLSVSRATIRAHGGDLRLRPGVSGLVAELRLPQVAPTRAAA